MTIRTRSTIQRAMALTVCALLAAGAAGGPLAPVAGPVAPTMKTLTEVEPRTAINATNTPGDATSVYKITQPGSYYLTENLAGVAGKASIVIATSGAVKIDLMGFEVTAAAGSFNAITSGAAASVDLRNGTFRGFVNTAVLCSSAISGRYQDLTVIGSGAGGTHGLLLGPSSIVTNCTVQNVGNIGIGAADNSVVTGCTVTGALGDGISTGENSVVSHCTARSCGNSSTDSGFVVRKTSTIDHCTARQCFYAGIRCAADADVSVKDCEVALCPVGIEATQNCNVVNNSLTDNDVGINVTGPRTRVDGNNIFTGAGTGIKADTASVCTITRNVVQIQASGTAYQVGAGNYVGSIVTLSGTVSSTNAWANFKN